MNKNIKNISFSERLTKLRLSLSFRNGKPVQKKIVAQEAGISITPYSQAENGIVPGDKVLYKLAKYYGVSVDYLRTGEGEPYRKGKGARDAGRPDPDVRKRIDSSATGPPSGPFDVPDSHADPFIEALTILKEIYDSEDPYYIPALRANLYAFRRAIRREHQISEQQEEISNLKDECDDLKKRLAALEDRFNNPPEQGEREGDHDGEPILKRSNET